MKKILSTFFTLTMMSAFGATEYNCQMTYQKNGIHDHVHSFNLSVLSFKEDKKSKAIFLPKNSLYACIKIQDVLVELDHQSDTTAVYTDYNIEFSQSKSCKNTIGHIYFPATNSHLNEFHSGMRMQGVEFTIGCDKI